MSAPSSLGQYVWYASYASCLSRERFMCYIQGGTAPGGTFINPGCTDQRAPRADVAIELPYGLYFADESQMWTGGIAFVDPTTRGHSTKGRAYLISRQQFEEVVAQESVRQHTAIDIGALLTRGHLTLGDGKYDKVVYCGEHEGYPLLTFTAPAVHASFVRPTPAYLRVVGRGLMEAHDLNAGEAAAYLAAVPGVNGNYSIADIVKLLLKEAAASKASLARSQV